QLAATRSLDVALLGDGLVERGEEVVEGALDAVQLAAEEDEGVADLLERHALVHQRLDQADAAHRGGGVEAARSAVLALRPGAAAAGQQAELHVLAESGLGELHSAGREEVDELRGRNTVRIRRLQPLELVCFARHSGPSRWIETTPVSGVACVHSRKYRILRSVSTGLLPLRSE